MIENEGLGKNITYLWNTGETTSSISVNNDNTQLYSVRVTDLDLNCYNEDRALIGLFTQPSVDLGEDIVVCSEDLVIDATNEDHLSNFLYLWNTDNTTPQITVNGSGTEKYIVEVINNNNTLACSSRDTIEVTFLPKPSFSITEFNFCADSTPITISVREQNHLPSFKYAWFDRDDNIVSFTDSLTISFTNIYRLEILDTLNSCSFSESIQVNVHELPIPRLPDYLIRLLILYLFT